MIFVDTGAWFASVVPSDSDHSAAKAWLKLTFVSYSDTNLLSMSSKVSLYNNQQHLCLPCSNSSSYWHTLSLVRVMFCFGLFDLVFRIILKLFISYLLTSRSNSII